MADTTFTAKVTAIVATWLQDINNFVYRGPTSVAGKTTPVGGDGIVVSDSAAGGLWKLVTFTNLLTYLTSALTPTNATNSTNAVNLTGSGTVSNTATGGAALTPNVSSRVDSGMVTIASALTPDIFGAAANTINYTGTASCTGFVAAAKAGMQRTLVCTGACTFTTSNNLYIEGLPSGTVVTMATNAIINVVALTTTSFKMTYSISGSFTATATGLTTSPTGLINYSIVNGVATISIPSGTFTGTSNATTFTLTGVPAWLTPPSAINHSFPALGCQDNGAAVSAYINITNTAVYNIVRLDQIIWTNSGSKSIYTGCNASYLLL